MKIALSFALVGFAAAACSSSSGGSSVTNAQACSDVAAAECAALDKCAAILVQEEYGDVSTCTTRVAQTCGLALTAMGTSSTAAQTESCSQALPSAACSDLFARNLPMTCQPTAGTVANGGACGSDAQCVSTYCAVAVNAVCGTCGTGRASAGATCTVDNDCAYGTSCASGKCAAPAASGAACNDTTEPCAVGLICSTGMCATAPTNGQACDGTLTHCDLASGDICNPSTKVCQPIQIAAGGGSCGGQNGQLAECSANGQCVGATTTANGTCLSAAADGATCDATKGPLCMQGAECVSGVCQIDDPSTCK